MDASELQNAFMTIGKNHKTYQFSFPEMYKELTEMGDEGKAFILENFPPIDADRTLIRGAMDCLREFLVTDALDILLPYTKHKDIAVVNGANYTIRTLNAYINLIDEDNDLSDRVKHTLYALSNKLPSNLEKLAREQLESFGDITDTLIEVYPDLSLSEQLRVIWKFCKEPADERTIPILKQAYFDHHASLGTIKKQLKELLPDEEYAEWETLVEYEEEEVRLAKVKVEEQKYRKVVARLLKHLIVEDGIARTDAYSELKASKYPHVSLEVIHEHIEEAKKQNAVSISGIGGFVKRLFGNKPEDQNQQSEKPIPLSVLLDALRAIGAMDEIAQYESHGNFEIREQARYYSAQHEYLNTYQIPDVDVSAELDAQYKAHIQNLTSDDSDVKRKALHGLAYARQMSVPTMVNYLKDTSNPNRETVLHPLRLINSKESNHAIRLAQKDDDPAVVKEAKKMLNRHGGFGRQQD